MLKVLILGCGNIGALYDFDNDRILTHAKAFFLSNKVELHLYDIDLILLDKIANKYKAKQLVNIDELDFSEYDIISICTPTFTHKRYLERALSAKVKLIICEKPISESIEEIDDLISLYHKSNSKVIVNYFRRFQPAFTELKRQIEEITKYEELTNLTIRTQRAFINNSSHAFDLIQFLFNQTIELSNVRVHNLVNDHFETDPTLSLQANWIKSNFILQGLSNVQFSFFEIDLFFTFTRISIREAGNDIKTYKSEASAQVLKPLAEIESLGKTDCTKDYMKDVIDYSFELFNGNKSIKDNFLEAAELNKSMLKILSNREWQN
jgi:predicted dehydrogenase